MTSYPKYMYLSPLGSNYIYLIPNIFICLPLVSTISYPLSAPLTKEVGYQGAVQPVPGEEPVFARVRMISPVEMDYAFVFAAWRDKDDHIKMDQWKR